ncbi:competence protein ComEA [Pseudoduganella lurida]|uniref:Competence protein ComEA n=1 Tax=Pseudoduganella lurida TaxID=1036180 RepID=A0A562R8Q1_9BURK|nr:helix-hairpin-helix domain-containing protein [Pseudoduganella lurida]TWI65263.1 competence protein ComEA [Pseudoduganella lurida]
MLKKLLLAVAGTLATMTFAFAQVDVNKADQAALDSVKGIGPAKSKAILEERGKGEFKDWSDFEKRVKGIGGKNAVKLSEAGLQVNGKARDGAAAKTPETKPAGAKSADMKSAETKSAEAKKDVVKK